MARKTRNTIIKRRRKLGHLQSPTSGRKKTKNKRKQRK